jgi:hypothetical protein
VALEVVWTTDAAQEQVWRMAAAPGQLSAQATMHLRLTGASRQQQDAVPQAPGHKRQQLAR